MTLEEIQGILTEMQDRVDHPLDAMRPFPVELSYPIARESSSKKFGITSKITFDADHDLYTLFQHGLPQGVVMRGVLWVESETAELHAKKPSKGDHGHFWNSLCKNGFMAHPDMGEIYHALRKANHRGPEYDASQLLRDSFAVTSRAQISPAALREWLRVRRLPEQSGVWILIDNAERGR